MTHEEFVAKMELLGAIIDEWQREHFAGPDPVVVIVVHEQTEGFLSMVRNVSTPSACNVLKAVIDQPPPNCKVATTIN